MSTTRNLRNLGFCFTNSIPESKSPPTTPTTTTTSTHQIHHNLSSSTSSTSTMIKNFNSLYDPSLTCDHTLYTSSLSTTSLEVEPESVDFAAAFASQRFFFSSPGSSNSLIEYTNTNCILHSSVSLMDKPNNTESENKEEEEEEKGEVLFNGSVAVPTYSPDPYMDFRRSMQEMVEARPELMDVKSNWSILHELLLCYLVLNPKNTHKFILGAFADLLISLMLF